MLSLLSLLVLSCVSLEVIEPAENAYAMDQYGYKWTVEGFTKEHKSLAQVEVYTRKSFKDKKENVPQRIVKIKIENIEKKHGSRRLNFDDMFLVFEAPEDSLFRRSDFLVEPYKGDDSLLKVPPVTFTSGSGFAMERYQTSAYMARIVFNKFDYGMSYPVLENHKLRYVVIEEENGEDIEIEIP